MLPFVPLCLRAFVPLFRHDDPDQPFRELRHVGQRDVAVALVAAQPAAGDQPAEPAVSGPVGGEQDDGRGVDGSDFGADDQSERRIQRRSAGETMRRSAGVAAFHSVSSSLRLFVSFRTGGTPMLPFVSASLRLFVSFLSRDMRPHHARQRVAIGDRQGRVAQRRGLLDQLLGVRGAAQEGEVAQAMQFGVSHRKSRTLRASRFRRALPACHDAYPPLRGPHSSRQTGSPREQCSRSISPGPQAALLSAAVAAQPGTHC